MARLELILVMLFIAFTIFAFIDCLRTEGSRVRALPKYLWLVLIVILTPFGGILWLTLGKDRTDRSRVPHSNHGPDDDPAFLRQLGEDKRRQERIRELEARLAELDDDQNNSKEK
jgi:hypothetical protein